MAPTRVYLLIENPSKSNNLGPVLRCASAFSVSEVVLVGYARFSDEGSHGAARHVPTVAFPTFEKAIRYLRADEGAGVDGGCGCQSVVGILGGEGGEDAYDEEGVEVSEGSGTEFVSACGGDGVGSSKNVTYPLSLPIHTRPFHEGNTCFLFTKNWKGIPASKAEYCDSFVHLPHCSVTSTVTASDGGGRNTLYHKAHLVDASAYLSIVLHHFTAWARFGERKFEGQKFEVSKVRRGEENRGQTKRISRAEIRAEAENTFEETIDEGALTKMFDEEV